MTALESVKVADPIVNPALVPLKSAIVPVALGKSGELRVICLASKVAVGGDCESSSEKASCEPVACKTWPMLRSRLPAESVSAWVARL